MGGVGGAPLGPAPGGRAAHCSGAAPYRGARMQVTAVFVAMKNKMDLRWLGCPGGGGV
jgi:hypothetical protein